MTDMVILSTPEVVSDLADKRSNIYSDRVSPPAETYTTVLIPNPQPIIPMLDLYAMFIAYASALLTSRFKNGSILLDDPPHGVWKSVEKRAAASPRLPERKSGSKV
jgi:hypothetical protein